MSTFAEDIEYAANGEPIEAIAVSKSRDFWSDEPDHDLGQKPVSWRRARPVLDYEYDAGYGVQDCHDFWAWTPTRVLFVQEYDGSTWVSYMPRVPCPFTEIPSRYSAQKRHNEEGPPAGRVIIGCALLAFALLGAVAAVFLMVG